MSCPAVDGGSFTPSQRRILITLTVSVVVVFAVLAGFIVTSSQALRQHLATLSLLTPTVSPLVPPTTQPGAATEKPTPTSIAEEESALLPQVRAARLLEPIRRQVEALRGLYPAAEMPLSFVNNERMAELLRSGYLARGPAVQLLPYTALELIPDVRPTITAQPVTALYVPEQRQLFLTATAEETDPRDQTFIARAYAAALLDQCFDLTALDARAPTTDARLAMHALIEGDRLLLTALYRYGDPASADWPALIALAQTELPTYGEAIDSRPAWQGLRSFPYEAGRAFVGTLYEMGGWEAVNRAYADPPCSCEQVLHPERYLGQRDVPAGVALPDARAALGAGWSVVVRDTLGEFVLRLYLAKVLDPDVARQAADGWDGDVLVVWGHPDGRRAWAWRSVWDTPHEAAEFERALRTFIPQQFIPGRPLAVPADSTALWWDSQAGAFFVQRLGRYVSFVHAPDAETLLRLFVALP